MPFNTIPSSTKRTAFSLHLRCLLVNFQLTHQPMDHQLPLLLSLDAPEMLNPALMMSVSRSCLDTIILTDDLWLEFAFEIGSSLLTEVRRLQSLLGERDKAIQDMKEEKDDLEKAVENLREALKTQEQNAGMYFANYIPTNYIYFRVQIDSRRRIGILRSHSKNFVHNSPMHNLLLNVARSRQSDSRNS